MPHVDNLVPECVALFHSLPWLSDTKPALSASALWEWKSTLRFDWVDAGLLAGVTGMAGVDTQTFRVSTILVCF